MNAEESSNRPKWRGETITVEILYSAAGVAQTILISGKDRFVLVDTGDGALRDLLHTGHSLKNLAGLIYTHGHFDHIGGLSTLLGFLRMIGRKVPLRIIAPRDCRELLFTVDNFKRCYPDSRPFEIDLIETDGGEFVELAGFKVEPYVVVHCGSVEGGKVLGQIPARGYRLSLDGETVAISGDTGLCDGVRRLVDGVDLAVIEATYADAEGIAPEMLQKVHLTVELAEQLARTARNHILVHRINKFGQDK